MYHVHVDLKVHIHVLSPSTVLGRNAVHQHCCLCLPACHRLTVNRPAMDISENQPTNSEVCSWLATGPAAHGIRRVLTAPEYCGILTVQSNSSPRATKKKLHGSSGKQRKGPTTKRVMNRVCRPKCCRCTVRRPRIRLVPAEGWRQLTNSRVRVCCVAARVPCLVENCDEASRFVLKLAVVSPN